MFKKANQTMVTLWLCCALHYSHVTHGAELVPLWTIENTFKLPESAAFDVTRNQIYISNIVKYAKDGSGFISRIGADGNDLELKWIDSLNSPTGLAVYGDILYAVDMDVLVVIDLIERQIVKRIAAPYSDGPPVLNDVAISKQGDVYVSGSASRKIYTLKDDALVVFIDDPDRLMKANGLLVDDHIDPAKSQLIHGGQFWSRYSTDNGVLLTNDGQPTPHAQLFDFDGITHDGRGGYIVTVIDDPRLWHITQSGITVPLSQLSVEGIDIDFDPSSRRLFVPRVGGSLSVFQLNEE